MVRRLLPGVDDLVFGLVLASVLIGGRYRLLNDPGTLWHLRLGREILHARQVPRADFLTFTHEGDPWIDQSWLFDVGLAAVVDCGGWSAAGAICGLAIAAVYAGLARGLLREGRAPLVVLVVGILAAGVGATHFLIRPHVVTLAFVLISLRLCLHQHEKGGFRVFLVPLLVIPWANMHGGFLAGPVIVLTALAGHAVSGKWDQERRRQLGRFGAAGGLCLIAALINPYGFNLYRHVGRLLVSSGVTELIEEYQPISFGKPDARAVEWVLLALIALPTVSTARMSRYELAHGLLWLHLSLASVRHAPLFGLAVAPGFARLLDGLPGFRAEAGGDVEPVTLSIWPGAAALGLGIAVAFHVPLVSFDPSHWPVAALPALNQSPTASRLFHEQDWGGFIEAECRPQRASYIDDRFELFGKQGVLDYIRALEGGPDWDELRDRQSIRLVWVRPDRGLARRLLSDPDWRVRHRDKVSVLFERANHPETVRSGR